VPKLVDVLLAKRERPGLEYLDRFGETVPWLEPSATSINIDIDDYCWNLILYDAIRLPLFVA
jgi:hypothetical protein